MTFPFELFFFRVINDSHSFYWFLMNCKLAVVHLFFASIITITLISPFNKIYCINFFMKYATDIFGGNTMCYMSLKLALTKPYNLRLCLTRSHFTFLCIFWYNYIQFFNIKYPKYIFLSICPLKSNDGIIHIMLKP